MRRQLTHALCATCTLVVGASVAAQQRPAATRTTPLDLVCAPRAAYAPPAQALKVVAGTERRKALFGPGETVIINAGTSQGLRAGQQYYIRRVIEDRFIAPTAEAAPLSIHTAGWLTVVETTADVAVARIEEACDGVAEGDYLEPLVLPPAAPAAGSAEPDFARPARVIMGAERRQLGAEHSLMVIDRGSDHGLRPGQRLTIFRTAGPSHGPFVTIGHGTVVSTQHETSVMRIERAREMVEVGDQVAIHR